jgi:LAO/AO transport system kinase
MTGALPARWPDPESLADAVLSRDRTAIATALNLLDDGRPEARVRASALTGHLAGRPSPGAHVIGITGPPGSGKSSLSSALIGVWREEGRTVGVLAVDPSSPRTGGALLGDRLRMLRPDGDDAVFIRSLASRGELGGLSPEAGPMSLVMLAAFDVVVVETVGIGQSEIDVSELADTTCCLVQPASGDTIQFLKSGIMEVPDLFAVSKSDLGVLAERTARELKGAIPRRSEGEWAATVTLVSARSGTGVAHLARAFAAHRAWLEAGGKLGERRRRHQARWVVRRLREEFGAHGIDRLGGPEGLITGLLREAAPPLTRHEALRERVLALYGSSEGEHT